jgi:hypothetical protein
MKNIKWLFITFIAVSLWSCDEEALDSVSIFGPEAGFVENAFDKWLVTNYVESYNIDFKYRLEDKESDRTYNLIPADYIKSIAMAKMTKHLWLGAYEELLGSHFIRTYCPRVLYLVGSPAYNTQGSIVLGTAEGGMKITLYNVNFINLSSLNIADLNYWYFKTMHHEFAHILHQTINYPPKFNLITPSDYQSTSWVNMTEKGALDLGFISTYASSETQEDFVELISIYITSTSTAWTTLVNRANTTGRALINQKLDVVREYLLAAWGINLDDLRTIVQRRSTEVLSMDLTTLN